MTAILTPSEPIPPASSVARDLRNMRYALQVSFMASVIVLASCGMHREIVFDSAYWKYVEKDAVYMTIRSTGVTTEELHTLTGSDSNRWDLRLHKSRHFQQRTANLPDGTLIQAKAVYVDSEPLQYHFISYGGVILNGKHKGRHVDFTQLLEHGLDGFYPNAKFLTELSTSDNEAGQEVLE